MNHYFCAPGKYDKQADTCFTLNELIQMASAYNRFVTKIQFNPTSKTVLPHADLMIIKPDKIYLLQQLKIRFQNICNTEICLTEQAFMNDIVKEMRETIVNDTFRKTGPQNSIEWLNTLDINNIMHQYTQLYPHFVFMGAVPSDCHQLSACVLASLDFQSLSDKKNDQVGIIYNLDKHNKPGSHWVAVYLCLSKGQIYYCDSTGKKPFKNVEVLANRFKEYCVKQSIPYLYQFNTKSYQKDRTECGVYACNFIIRMLAGETFEQIINQPLSFKAINSCRNVYFQNAPSEYVPHYLCDPHSVHHS